MRNQSFASFFLFCFFLLFIRLPPLFSCDPCYVKFDFNKTAWKADLIIIGEKISNGPETEGGPDWINIRILEVLKGKASDSQIKVNSFDLGCPYGIDVDDRRYIFFLANKEDNYEEYLYDAVNGGCAVKYYLIQDGRVNFDGKSVAIDEFKFTLKREAGSG